MWIDNPFTWHFYKRYRVIPAVLDRHVVEFFPERFPRGSYRGRTLGVDAFSLEAIIERNERTHSLIKEQALGQAELDSSLFARSASEMEQLVEMLSSLFFDERKSFYVNTLNNGAVPNVHVVLELPAVVSARGFYPYAVLDSPHILAGMITRRIAEVDLTVEAALKGDKSLFVEALLLGGSVQDEEVAIKGLTTC